jgi:hypothetical protein
MVRGQHRPARLGEAVVDDVSACAANGVVTVLASVMLAQTPSASTASDHRVNRISPGTTSSTNPRPTPTPASSDTPTSAPARLPARRQRSVSDLLPRSRSCARSASRTGRYAAAQSPYKEV